MTPQPAIDLPKLRAVDLRPHHQNGQAYYMLRDPLQLTENVLLIPQPLAALLAFCDGSRSTREIAGAFRRQFGVDVGVELVEDLVTALDQACFLDNNRAQAARQAAVEAYRAAPSRPSLLASQSYPGSAKALRALFDGYLADVAQTPALPASQPSGLLSPHID
jgi:MEMO1 family protein